MTGRKPPKSIISRLKRDVSGNFSIMTAIFLPVLLGAAGTAIDIARAMQIKSDLEKVADAAVLSATTKARLAFGKMTEQQLQTAASDYIASSAFNNDLPEEERFDFSQGNKISAARLLTEKGEEFEVRSDLHYNMKLNPLLSFIGFDYLPISASATAKSSFNNGAPLSLYLLLDRSKSMDSATETAGINKIASLKLAVKYLVETLQTSDPTYSPTSSKHSSLVRTGAISYNHQAFPETPLNWGTDAVIKYTNNLPSKPDGYTSAIDAMKAAIKALERKNTKEALAHKANGSSSFERYIVFMTDGEMTGKTARWDASIDANVRSLCATAKNDGIAIFTVAFMAPTNGKKLLQYCASSSGHYYAPEKMADLVNAFGDIARKASSKIATLTN